MAQESFKWICILKTQRRFEAEALKGQLEASEIPCVLMNKQDVSYPAIGFVELMIPETFKTEAFHILNQNEN